MKFDLSQLMQTRLGRFSVVTAGVIVGLVQLNIYSWMLHVSTEKRVPPAAEETRTVSPEAVTVANQNLNWAHGESMGRLEPQFAPVEELFDQADVYTFAESCLSWRSKWLLAKDKLFDSAEHAALIDAEFRRLIFDHEELERLLTQCTTAYVQEMKDVDNDFLVRLSVDWQGLPAGSVPGFDPELLRAQYNHAVRRAIEASKSDVAGLVQREAVGWLISEVMTTALVELGVSSGILATGAAAGWGTFGVSIVVGVLVDYGIQQYTDPEGKLAAEVGNRLQQLRHAILFGDEEAPGLIPRLQEFANERAKARRDAIQEYLYGKQTVTQASYSF
jgi:hypothetical protein